MNHRQRIPPNPPYQGGQPAGRGDCFLPYNKALVPCAKELRKNMTEAEKKIWYEIFRNKQFEDLRWLRQRPIADFERIIPGGKIYKTKNDAEFLRKDLCP